MFADCFAEAFAAHETTGNIITNLHGHPSVVMTGLSQRITERPNGRPLFSQGEIGRCLHQIIRTDIRPAVPAISDFGVMIINLLQVGLNRLAKDFRDFRREFRLVVLDRDYVVSASLDNLFDDRFLTAHRVDRDDGIAQVDLLQQLGNRRDFIGFFLRRDLAQRVPLLACPGADNVHCPEAFGRVVRTPASLSVDGNQSTLAVWRDWKHSFGPLVKALLKRFGFQHH